MDLVIPPSDCRPLAKHLAVEQGVPIARMAQIPQVVGTLRPKGAENDTDRALDLSLGAHSCLMATNGAGSSWELTLCTRGA